MSPEIVIDDVRLISRMLRPFRFQNVAAVCARLVPGPRCGVTDACEMKLSFPAESDMKDAETLLEEGRNALRLSHNCAVYDTQMVREAGGFPEKCVTDEDLLMAAKLMQGGASVAYCAPAEVTVDIRRSDSAVFRHAFDEGMVWAQHPEITSHIAVLQDPGEKEDARELLELEGLLSFEGQLARRRHLRKVGFSLGCHYNKIPAGIVRSCSLGYE